MSCFRLLIIWFAAAASIATPVAALAAPAKMQAIVQSTVNGAEALQLQTVDTPQPGPGRCSSGSTPPR